MIRLIEAKGYRCLCYVSCPVHAFEILVGPNASGKSSFFEVVGFMGDLVANNLEYAVSQRSSNLQDLIWEQQGSHFELALEMDIPPTLGSRLPKKYQRCRYEISVGIEAGTQINSLLGERLLLMPSLNSAPSKQRPLFPCPPEPPDTLIGTRRSKAKTVVHKVSGGNDNFYDETGKGWDHAFKLGPGKSALGNLPEDETKFPVSTWFKRTLSQGVQHLALNSAAMRYPSPPGQPPGFRPDGSNLPWTIKSFKSKDPIQFERWLSHVRTALPDIQTIETIERPEDRHCYLRVLYQNGLRIPSWGLSDGTLRLLALTLISYLDEPTICLIEEPENGIHPQAVETVFQALSSAEKTQILCATHSPVILAMAKPDQILCFGRTPEGATDIVRGTEHPHLQNWQRSTDLGTLFASGVLG
jgi:predicted ATPase